MEQISCRTATLTLICYQVVAWSALEARCLKRIYKSGKRTGRIYI